MKNIEARSDSAILKLVTGAQVLLPLLGIILFRRLDPFPARAFGYHLLLIEGSYLALFGTAALLTSFRAVRSRPAGKYLLPLAWGSLTVVLYFSYLLAWGGRVETGMNLKPALIAPYVLHPSLVFSTLPVSPAKFWGVLVLAPTAILLVYVSAANALSAVSLRSRISWLARPWPPTRRRRVSILASVTLLTLGGAIWREPPLKSASHFFGDPIFQSLLSANSILPTHGLDNAASKAARSEYMLPRDFQRKNVILIVLDACRADHLGVMGYRRDTTPFLDSLQRSGHLHMARSFYSASCCTFGGVLTLLRSQHWFKMTIHGFALQDVLKKAGYRVHFDLSGEFRNFFNMKLYYGNSIDSFADGSSPDRHFSLNDDRGVLESLDAIAPDHSAPAFFYFHLIATHELGLRQPADAKYLPADHSRDPVRYLNYYDNGIVQADSEIRQLFERLAQKGYLQNSLVIITGDHGESLGERNRYGHTQNLYAEEITPPLLIYDTDPVEYPHLNTAQQIDVAPTILDRLGLPIPSSWDGHSLLHGEPERFSYLRLGDYFGVIDNQRTLKYIYNAAGKTEEIYDLNRDPHDLQNVLSTTGGQEIQELRTAIGAFSIHPGT